jgi:TPR repeat protein
LVVQIDLIPMIAFLFAVNAPPFHGGVSQAGTAPVEMKASVDKLSSQAVMGDALAASKLSDYYRYEKNMDEKWKYWALIAAENGDAGSQFDEYNILAESDDPLDQHRAFFWLKRSAQNGFSGAAIELQRCFPSGSFESRQPGCLGSSEVGRNH